jgi:hypothetical protein
VYKPVIIQAGSYSIEVLIVIECDAQVVLLAPAIRFVRFRSNSHLLIPFANIIYGHNVQSPLQPYQDWPDLNSLVDRGTTLIEKRL